MLRPFDYDEHTGVTTTYEDTPEGFKLHYSQDCEPIIERNKMLQTNVSRDRGSEMVHVADVPIGIQYEWLHKYGVDFYDKNHWPAVRRLLNSSEYRWLKTKEIII